ncbi:DUF2236 domain-containing protein [Altererythrobacter xixiisoli]|uniref:DUF2236 domain-containing protein n=1 Tax=Croceibacterium xixiisoli TaxID=1476466 RepID=A0A6I4TX94_9SPHN|nr:oxygenase MpaB family protein [Croceibacterium xixiisoli]MXO99437.1 DUF2236 domain-containing protein [Croceibacterium xixiisoli]
MTATARNHFAPGARLSERLRARFVGQVRSVFNDASQGEVPVVPSDHALYPRGSVIWRVHGDVATMMVGGVAALLLQMLHPAALAGVWDHSHFRNDMQGRLRRTARFIAKTTYAEKTEAEAAIARVRQVHDHVRGTLPDGTPYSANDPELLAWVHVCEALCFLDAWRAFGEPGISRRDQDAYFAQAALVARALGADPVPESRAEAEALIRRFRPALRAETRTREVARMVLDQPALSRAMAPMQAVTMQAAIGILPRWAQDLHGLHPAPLTRHANSAATWAMAGTLRWAFRRR